VPHESLFGQFLPLAELAPRQVVDPVDDRPDRRTMDPSGSNASS
jgi:hypothetical protein